MLRLYWVLFVFLSFCFEAGASDLVFSARVATVLNTVTLYPDSNYYDQSNTYFSEGELLEVLEESKLEHEDDAQNQKFKWYKVRSLSGQEGWIYGDGLAVITPDSNLPKELKSFHKQKIVLDNGFENAVLWLAGVEGRDNMHDNDLLNPIYTEYYLVLTSELGRSVHINFSGQSAMGRKEMQLFEMRDITGDHVQDFILQTNSFSTSSDLENRVVEIFSLQSGTLRKVLEERMTLTYDDDLSAPSMFKFVEIADKSIRIEFVDYVACKKYSLPYQPEESSKTLERCMEFVTYTYVWSNRKKTFEQFYKENRSAVKGIVNNPKIWMRTETSFLSDKVELLKLNQPFVVIKHYEKFFMQNGQKKLTPYLFVQTASGKKGYIRGKEVQFLKIEHARTLMNYYRNPPLSKTDLKSSEQFLKIVKKKEENFSGESVGRGR